MKRLILAPHMDDEAMGCGGLMSIAENITFDEEVDEDHLARAVQRAQLGSVDPIEAS